MPQLPIEKTAVYNASHVLMVAPNDFRFNSETSTDNAFQHAGGDDVAALAERQHRELRSLLVKNGVTVTLHLADPATPAAPGGTSWWSPPPRV
ncbi:MAG: hypothetical protein JJU11_12515, partial [Candidatus Sumerlaeia bacterium]|nr:hypothetical protein [Candidatus Sumerlaeia bacterium]